MTALFLFGSAARGDLDSSSDIDVLLIYENESDRMNLDDLLHNLKDSYGDRISLAEYSLNRLSKMFSEGHLFAWHLYKEAKPLSQSYFRTKTNFGFPRPAEYKSGVDDANRFLKMLQSVIAEVQGKPASLIHEAGLIYLCLRNIAMSLSAVDDGAPDFSRTAPFAVSERLESSYPCSKDFYSRLVQARHASQRGLPEPFFNDVNFICEVLNCYTWGKDIVGRFYER